MPRTCRSHPPSLKAKVVVEAIKRRSPIPSVPEIALDALGELVDEVFLEREQPLGPAVEAHAGLGRLDAPAQRSSSCSPSRFSSARTCRETAGCVTPSRSAACENERRSTTVQNARSCRASITRSSTRWLIVDQEATALRRRATTQLSIASVTASVVRAATTAP